jgi:lipoprotein-releasing system ATP-binding protein
VPDSVPLRGEALARIFHAPAGALTVFSGIDIEVRRGERVALTGESGAGKTTLLYCLGLLDRPSSGRVYIHGSDASALAEPELAALRNRAIGFVWQRNTLLAEFTALENVMMPLLIRGESRTAAGETASQLLDEVGLAARAHHLAGELSGGEQQRVALARALAGGPSILLADEPTGSLDEKTASQVMELIERVHHSRSLATLYVTHNLSFARRADRVLRLEGGRLQAG